MLFVQHNLLAENANRQLKVSTGKNAKLTEKLSSGYKINRAADDAAGLSISEKMRRQVRGLHQTVSNISEGVGYVQTAEGALNEVHDMLQRINELAVKAANGTNTVEDRAAIDAEIQHLKNEMNRIFSTTTYNEKKIWEPGDKKLLGYDKRQAVNFTGSSYQYIPESVTNANCGVIANSTSDYIIRADAVEGVWVEWKGWDDEDYTTEKISWKDLEDNNYTFEMSDYFGEKNPATNNLYTTNDKGEVVPQFKHTVSFSVEDTATIDDIVACIKDTRMSAYSYTSMSNNFQNMDGSNKTYTGVAVGGASLNYTAAYASYIHGNSKGHNFDGSDDAFLEPALTANGGKSNLISYPQAATVEEARASTDKWVFSFYMEGIGTVTGTSTSISYYSYDWSDYKDDDENIWWYKYGSHNQYKTDKPHSAAGTLGGLMSALTGTKDEYNYGHGTDSTPGLLLSSKGGATDKGGSITLNFSLTADQEFTYGKDKKSSSVGSFSIRINVDTSDTEETMLQKINNALNGETIMDFSTSSAGSDHHEIDRASAKTHQIDIPIYGGICGFYVQGGTEGGQHISVQYEALSTIALGIGDTNTRTIESASNAINEVKGALRMVSEQRSTFGAYQNRLEHASNINANIEENTQAAESRIRDSDIADLMMEYSVNNILMQAGTSMLTQANQSSQSILELLQ